MPQAPRPRPPRPRDPIRVVCPYCGQPAVLEDSVVVYGRSFGKIWRCTPCEAWVGTHRNSPRHVPLGRLANAELRDWKRRAHAALDPFWVAGQMTRQEVYVWAASLFGKPKLHIGHFDVADCQRLIDTLKQATPPPTKGGQQACGGRLGDDHDIGTVQEVPPRAP